MVSLGPVPLPVVLAITSLLLALLVARSWRRVPVLVRRTAVALLVDMFLLGLLGARVVFVLRAAPLYLADPWSVLRVGDGGFDVIGFLLAASAWAAWKLRAQRILRTVVVTAASVGVVAWSLGSLGVQHWQAQQLRLPALVLQDLQERPAALSSFAGQPLVVNLWASWCGPCIREMPVLAAAQREHGEVRFLFVNQGEDRATVQDFLQQHAPSLSGVLLDESSTAGQQLGVQAYPSTLFFDAEGRLRDLHLGELTAAGLEHKLRRLR